MLDKRVIYFQNKLLILGKRVPSDKLHDFVKLGFFLKNFFELGSQVGEFGVEVIEVGVQLSKNQQSIHIIIVRNPFFKVTIFFQISANFLIFVNL